MNKLWICSDQHLFHKNIIKYCNRPFTDEYEMNACILENHNKLVKKDDNVIFLGDVSAGVKGRQKELKELLIKFNGNKILLLGNHDHESPEFYKECGFQSVGNYLIIGDFFLSHYGLENNQYTSPSENRLIDIFKKTECKVIVHGHKHISEVELNEQNTFTKRFNCSLDLHNFEPVLLNTFLV